MLIKKIAGCSSVIFVVWYAFLFVFPLCAYAQDTVAKDRENTEPYAETSLHPLNPKTGFPEIIQKPFLMINEGITFSQVTRIEKQTEHNRSNFVRQNYLIGAYCSAQTTHVMPLNLQLRAAVYYPFYHTFNGMRQFPKQTILYAFDVFLGPIMQMNMWNYLRVNLSAGLHYMYQLSDEYHLHFLGAGAAGGLELPVAWHWTMLIDGIFSLDYPNLGTNRRIQPYNYAWTYQLSIGVRYSKKGANKYSYIGSKKRTAQMQIQLSAPASDTTAQDTDASLQHDTQTAAASSIMPADDAESTATAGEPPAPEKTEQAETPSTEKQTP